MEAKIGDEIVIDARETGGSRREGEVLEVRRAGDVLHYVVRWDDGHESVFYPGSDAHVVRLGRHRPESPVSS